MKINGYSLPSVRLASALAVLGGLLAGPAYAAGVCKGTLSASPSRPIPQPITVAFDKPLETTANPDLGKQFLNGVREAGVSVVDKADASLTLDLSFTVRSGKSGKPSTYHNLNWMRSQPAPAHIGGVLHGAATALTIYARDTKTHTLAWPGAVSCIVQTDDVQALAHGLGEIVGRSLGRVIPKTAL